LAVPSSGEGGGEEWEHQLVVADELEAFPAAADGTLDDVHARTIVADEVEVRGREICERVA
jgi:hypothetical protein